MKDDGSFILVDVPQGSYRLTGKVYEESGGQAYTFEISEQVNVSENKPVQLGKLPIVVTRSLRSGEAVPTFELARFDDPDKTVRHTDFEDSFLLVYFWGLDSELSLIELSSLEELREKLSAESANVEFLGICLDEKTQIDGEFLRYRQLDWHASSGGWQGDTVEQFGVRKLPYYCLVNPKGKVVVSNELFRNLFQSANMNLEVVIRHVLAGKDMQDMLDAAKGQGQNK